MATQKTNAEPRPDLRISLSSVPTTMRAVVYHGINDLRLETVPVPVIGPGELLVKIATCGVCGTDLKKIHLGSHSAPRIFGHEMAGTIVRAGEGVNKFAVGERVMVYHHIPCGQCYYCRKQTFAQCSTYKKVGATAGFEPSGGGFSEYIRVMDWIVRMGGVVRIPDGVPFEQAAFMEPVNTVLKGVKLLHLAADETVLVIGQGPIGILLAALSRRTGARVLTSDLYPERQAIAAKFGLHEPIQAGNENVVERAMAATEGRGADAVILAVGGSALIPAAMAAVRPGGKVMLFAQTQHETASFDPGAVCMDEKTLLGSYSASTAIQPEVEELVLGGYRDGFDLTQLISHRFPLEEAVQAIEIASNPKADSMKIMIESAPGAGAERGGD
jgi:L-iditol 2-dehydrogenase